MAVEKFFATITQYLEARFELFKLEIQESATTAIVRLIQAVVVGVFGFVAVIFFSIGLIQVLNFWLQNPFVGYFIVGGLYLVPIVFLLSASGSRLLKAKIEQNLEVVLEKSPTGKTSGMSSFESGEVGKEAVRME